MKQVYSPTNSAEAHMLAHQLEIAGIKAFVHGEQLQGAAGDLPAGGVIQLLVADEDYDEARRLLDKWDASPAASDGSAIPKFPIMLALAFLAAGLIAGWIGRSILNNSAVAVLDSSAEYDMNGDNKTDIVYFYRAGEQFVHRIDTDSNFDERMDVIAHYNADGAPIDERVDRDFDGVFESRSTFRYGIRERTEIDSNNNSSPDIVLVYEDGLLKREEIHDERVGRLARVNHYDTETLQRAELDLDRDGFLETVRTFDRFGEITGTETRTQ